jgi:hypothetical protein
VGLTLSASEIGEKNSKDKASLTADCSDQPKEPKKTVNKGKVVAQAKPHWYHWVKRNLPAEK